MKQGFLNNLIQKLFTLLFVNIFAKYINCFMSLFNLLVIKYKDSSKGRYSYLCIVYLSLYKKY
jgi:hypothetical protein